MKTADKQELQKNLTYYVVNLHNMRIERFRIRDLFYHGSHYIAGGHRTTEKNRAPYFSHLSKDGLRHTYRDKNKAKNFLRRKLRECLKSCEQF